MLGIAWGLFLIGKTEERKTANPENPIEATIFQAQGDATNKNEINSNFYPVRNWEIKDPEISAKSAVVINFKNQNEEGRVVFQKNADQVLPIASLTKLMTAIIVMENLDLEEIIKFSNEEKLTVKNLLYIMLIESDNDVAATLARDNSKISFDQFLNLMNKKAEELGLKNTYFSDSAGLDPQNQSTVLELVKITNYSLKFPIIWDILKMPSATVYSIDNKFVHNLTTTNKLLGKIPQIIGGKTGFTEEAGGCMLTVSNISKDNYLIAIILGSSQREIDMENLLNWAQEAYIWQ